MLYIDESKMRIDAAKIAERAQASVRATVSFIIQDIAEEVVAATPVKTGNLRASWVLGVNSVPSAGQTRTPIASGERFPSVDPQTVDAISVNMADYQLGDTVFFVNFAAYAAHVEYGTSRTDGAAMVRTTLARAGVIANQAADRILAFKSAIG